MDKLIASVKKYIRPTELTFWLGAILIFSGIIRANSIEVPYGISATVRPVLDAYFGGSSTALILAGIGFISVNGKASGDKV